MPLIEVRDPVAWDAFIATQPWSQFTQSWAWGDFRMSRGESVVRLALTNRGEWEAAAQFIYYPKPLVGGYWYAPRGPVIRQDAHCREDGILKTFLDELAQRGLPRRSLFWRIEPPIRSKMPSLEIHPFPFVRSHAYMPAATRLLDLSKTEHALLSEMHEKTRYNIRVAERNGVTVRLTEDIEAFLRMNRETAARDRFVSQPENYIRATYDFLNPRGMAAIRFAERDGSPLAASIEMTYGDTRTYLYGASSSERRHLMAPYALHWDAISSAKRDGLRIYDFHGTNPDDPDSPAWKSSWAGISRFKKGWGGETRELVGTWELPRMKSLYRVFRWVSR